MLKQTGQLILLPRESQLAADMLYISTVKNLYAGLNKHMEKIRTSLSKRERQIAGIWFEEVHANNQQKPRKTIQ
jgi:hypothetical protein